MLEAVFTSVMRASFLSRPSAPVDPAGLYLVQWPMTLVVPVDRESGPIAGEILYAGAPLHTEPGDEATVLRLLGRN